jgi:uncharacterized cupin superfamily protein
VAPLAHWDEVEPARRRFGHIAGAWADLGSAAGSIGVGVRRVQLVAGSWSTPAHVELAEEEIFYVLGGSGLSWQDGETFEVGPGDCLVHLIEREAHTLRAGPDGLEVLAFGMRVPAGGTLLRRAGLIWHWPGWAEAPLGKHPFEREADAGEPELPAAPSERPERIVATAAVELSDFGRPGQIAVRDLGRAAGSQLTGLRHVTLAAGTAGAPPHCHAAEEELFVVLDGGGVCTLGEERHEVRRGHVVARPPGTGVPHSFAAGDAGLTYLAYGTRVPSDIVYYPDSREIALRGVGVRFVVP